MLIIIGLLIVNLPLIIKRYVFRKTEC